MKWALLALTPCLLSAQLGWKDLGANSVLKGSAFKAGLSALVNCPNGGVTYCASPANTEAFAGLEQFVMAAQSGGAIDKIHNHITFTGGGHNDYYGNQVYDFDMGTGTITRLTDPSQISTFTFPQYSLDGTAASSHTGQGLIYMPNEDCVFKMAIGVSAAPTSQGWVWWLCNQRTGPTWVAKYANPVQLPYIMGSGATGCTPNSLQLGTFIGGGGTGATFTVWIDGTGVPTGYGFREGLGSGPYTSLPTSATISTCTGTESLTGGQLGGGGVFNGSGDQGSMWVLDTSTYNPAVPSSESIIGISVSSFKVYRYTPGLDTGPGGSNPFTTLSTLSVHPTYGTCRINPALTPAHLVCVGATVTGYPTGGIYDMPLSGAGAFQFTNITSSTSGCSALYSVVNPGFEYDDSTGLFVGFAGTGNAVTIFDYNSLTCVTRTFSGGPTNAVTVSPTGAGYDRALSYFPKLNTFLLAPNALNDMFTLKMHVDGLGSSTLTCKDSDGDGYGVGAGCTGPDADDSDATVNTTATVISKYGNIQTFLEHIGYQNASSLATVYCISNSGSGSTASTNADTACTTPYPAWANLPSLSVPYIVIFRGGAWTTGLIQPTGGSSSAQNVLMAYPGELPVIDFSGGILGYNINTAGVGYVTVDGLKLVSNNNGSAYLTGTNLKYPTTSPITAVWNAVYRCDISGSGTDAGIAGNNVIQFSAEENVLHDPTLGSGGGHNFYMGANTSSGSTIAVRRNIMYNENTGAGYPSLQINGKCLSCYVEQNIMYNADEQQIALLEGVSNSFIRGNLTFNTGVSGSGSARALTIYNYDSGQCRVSAASSICAYDQTNNIIANNTFWVGTLAFDGSGTIGTSYETEIVNLTTSSTTCPSGSMGPCGNLGGNFWYNNIIVALSSNNGADAPVSYDSRNPANYLASDTWTDNIIQNAAGFSTFVAVEGGTGLTCSTFSSAALSGSGCSTSNPQFVASSTSFYNTPNLFNFRLSSASPAIAAGINTVQIPLLDILGTPRSVPAALGGYEFTGSSQPSTPGSYIP